MNQTRFLQLGWVAAFAVLGVAAAGGFQDAASKVGVVDISQVVENSDFGKQNQDAFKKMKASREGLLEFIDTNRVLTTEQAQRLRDLTIKPNPTTDDTNEIERVKADVVAANKKWTEISQKATLTAEERTLLEEYARRSQAMADFAQRLYNQFTNEMRDWADKQKIASVQRARVAIQKVAKAQGYTVVFEVGVAPYGANDLSADALTAMNALPAQ